MTAAPLLGACGDGGGDSSNPTTTSTSSTTGAAGEGAGGAGGGTGGQSTTSSTTGGGGTGGSTPTGCQSNADCAMDMNGPVCDPSSGKCVTCIPVSDPAADCGIGSWCVPSKGQCDVGCTGDADCTTGENLTCDMDLHICVGCVSDDTCPDGAICLNQQCLPGCTPTHNCQAGFTCCGQQCFDLAVDENNCGQCNNFCEPVSNASVLCQNGACQQGVCNPNFADCNGSSMDGCETNTIVDGACVCKKGDVQSCYFGAPGSQNVGPCKAGTQTCNDDGLSWGPCTGQVLPQPEVCANGIDENCDGIMDNAADADNDGWSTCEGDCNDNNALVNPGAFEVTYTLLDDDNNPMTPPKVVPGGNGIDDDCDPSTSDTVNPPACGPSGVKLTGVTATDVANAMDLCQTTTLNAPKPTKKWGLISADFRLSSGAAPSAATLTQMQNYQAAIMTQYGYLNGNPASPNNPPKKGLTMAGISTGKMRYTGQADFVSPNGGYTVGTADACPAAYKAAHNGSLPSSLGCNGGNCTTANSCNDGIEVKLQVRVPTNAKSMSYDFKFYSGEFPEWVCTSFNDFYLALLTTGAAGIPADKNVSFDGLGNPVSVNNGFFDVCSPSGCFTCPKGVAELAGTGMEGSIGGGTSWLSTDAPVVPGEVITLELITFDVGDSAYDSNALLDNFRWGLSTTSVKTHE